MYGFGGPMRPNVMPPGTGMPNMPNTGIRPAGPTPMPMTGPVGVMRPTSPMLAYPQSTAMPMQQPQMAAQLTQALGTPPRQFSV